MSTNMLGRASTVSIRPTRETPASGARSVGERRAVPRVRAEDAFAPIEREPVAGTATAVGPTDGRRASRVRAAGLGARYPPRVPASHAGASERAYAGSTRRGYDPDDEYADEPSFAPETSFVRAPLAPRVPSSAHVPTYRPASPYSPSSSPPASPERRRASDGYGAGTGAGKGKGRAPTDGREARDAELAHAPVAVQEALVLEDLLSVLMGIEGIYITHPPGFAPDEHELLQGVRFVVSPALDPSLADLVERVLPLGTYFTALSAFLAARSDLSYGLVNHALCAAMRGMLADYQTLLAQLEHAFTTQPAFSLQKLWFYAHPTLHTLRLLFVLAQELCAPELPAPHGAGSDDDSGTESDSASQRARDDALGLGRDALAFAAAAPARGGGRVLGGEVLATLADLRAAHAGDPAAHALFSALLRAAGAPYVRILRRWVTRGELADAHGEVLVREDTSVRREGGVLESVVDEYWERRYTLRDGSDAPGPARVRPGVPPPRAPGGRRPGGACVPPPLESWKSKVLRAGKYLNVVRECARSPASASDADADAGVDADGKGPDLSLDLDAEEEPEDDDEELSLDDERLYALIERAYTRANAALLRLLLHTRELGARLRALRATFFLSQAPGIPAFLDTAAGELRKSARGASVPRLQSLLELARAAARDDALQDVRVVLASAGLYDWLLKIVGQRGALDEGGLGLTASASGGAEPDAERREKEKKEEKALAAIDVLALDHRAPFPLSLVLSRKALLRYQLLFRFLLHLRHVEGALGAMWIEHKAGPWRASLPGEFSSGSRPGSRPRTPGAEGGGGGGGSGGGGAPKGGPGSAADLGAWRLRVCVLRARMLAFVQHVGAFAALDVLGPAGRALDARLTRVRTVDELLALHVAFLDGSLKGCMLTHDKLLRAHSKIMQTCATFAVYAASFTKSAAQGYEAVTDGGDLDPAMPKRWLFLDRFEKNFNHWFKNYVDLVRIYASRENSALLPLVTRLNNIDGGS